MSFIKIIFYINFFLNFSSKFALCDLSQPSNELNKKPLQYRLPNNTVPLHYIVNIRTLLQYEDFQFSGTCIILLSVVEQGVKEILLHTKNSNIGNVSIKANNNNESIIVETVTLNSDNDIMQVVFNKELNLDETYHLTITYDSRLRDDNSGFFKFSYGNNWLGATQFIPTDARHAFPCYDEPKFKATFSIIITHPNNLEVISNMDVLNLLTNADRTHTTIFKTTRIMSTYLVNFVISDFVKRSSVIEGKDGIQLFLYARSDIIYDISYATFYTINVYQKLLDYFGENSQPMKIIKQIAIPDLNNDAYENWGIINYKESKLIYKENLYGSRELLKIVYLITHQLVHQWFGNLVSIDWWTCYWLNDGFATLYGYYGINMTNPSWRIMEHYQVHIQQVAFQFDEQKLNRPISFYIEKPKDIIKKHNSMAYKKASSILRMFENSIGRSIFKQAIDTYLKHWKYKAVSEQNLYDTLEETLVSNNVSINISEMFKSWTLKTGYPIVHLHIKKKEKKKEMTLMQERFLSYNDSKNDSLWHIPINYEIENGNHFRNTTAIFWMKNRQVKFTIPSNRHWNSDKNWIIINVQQTGYYRVNYDSANWFQIIRALLNNHTSIHTHNRAQLIDDAFNLARINKLGYNIVFELLEYLVAERNYSPWAAFDKGIVLLKRKLIHTRFYKHFVKYMQSILLPPYQHFGLVSVYGEVPLYSLTRQIIAKHACGFQLRYCINSKLDYGVLDMRPIYYSMKLKNMDRQVLRELKSSLTNTNDLNVRADYISSIGYFESRIEITQLLMQIIRSVNPYNLSKQEKLSLTQSIYRNSEIGLSSTLNFILYHSYELKIVLPDGGLDEIIEDIAKYVQINEHIVMFYKLLGAVKFSQKSIIKSKQSVINTLEWNMIHNFSVAKWIDHKYNISYFKTVNTNIAPRKVYTCNIIFIYTITIITYFMI